MEKLLDEFLRHLMGSDDSFALEVQLWNGVARVYGKGSPSCSLIKKTRQALAQVLRGGLLGFGEAYMSGNLEVVGDFSELMRLGANPRMDDLKLSWTTKFRGLLQYLATLNTHSQAPKNIAHHYDLGNDFYALWLDESMTYSCAYFKEQADTLEQAQAQKYEHICRKLQLKAGESLVDVGCGWGGMLIYAAENYHVTGVGCTLSRQQLEYAREKIKERGLENQIQVVYQDYRSLSGEFDKFVSIGMFEHVGKKYIPVFSRKMRELLKENGIGLLHTIGKEKVTPGDAWTLKYIFPGGYIPVLSEILRAVGEHDLSPEDVENLGQHYALTLDRWSQRFEQQVTEIERLYDAEFVRMWRLFLYGSSAGFRYGDTRLYQILLTRGLQRNLPLTRARLYI